MRPFTDTLNQLRFGTLSDDLTKALHELTLKCGETGRAGRLTLDLQLKPGKGGQIEVFDDIKLKLPKEERGSSIMFSTPEGNLTREDPRQMQIEGLRTVDKSTGELKRVAGGA
jgi:hypothetical protein